MDTKKSDCPHCGVIIPKWAELKSCEPILNLMEDKYVKCMKCDTPVEKNQWIDHARDCKFKPSQCRVCEKYIPIPHLDKHWKSCTKKDVWETFKKLKEDDKSIEEAFIKRFLVKNEPQ